VTPAAKREMVAHAQAVFGLSERRACGIIGLSRRVNSYASQRPDDDALRARLRTLGVRKPPVRLSSSGVSFGARRHQAQP